MRLRKSENGGYKRKNLNLLMLQYFDKLEKKEEMEEKMLNTTEMKTKAVTCHVCNYTSFKVCVGYQWQWVDGSDVDPDPVGHAFI